MQSESRQSTALTPTSNFTLALSLLVLMDEGRIEALCPRPLAAVVVAARRIYGDTPKADMLPAVRL